MKIRAALLDFDGTLVTTDLLDVFCGLAGKQEQSAAINQAFHDDEMDKMDKIEALTKRINLLNGVAVAAIETKLRENLFLSEGAGDLMAFLRNREVVTILNSGQIRLALQIYQEVLGIDYVVGTRPLIEDGIIRGISSECPIGQTFKLDGCKAILDELGILPEQVVAIGDSMADEDPFRFAAISIAVNPKDKIRYLADHVIGEDLRDAIPIIEQAMEG